VDEQFKVVGIVSDRDLLNAFIEVLGIKQPGTLLGVVVEEKSGEIKNIVNAIVTANIAFGSILVYRGWRPGKEAIFPYLFGKNISSLKRQLINMGYDVLDPIEWYGQRAT
jgi:acetoin utilization protein AcuB